MGKKTMNIEKTILIMRNELECFKNADECDRHCEDCPLVMEAEDIIECYEWVIKHLEMEQEIKEGFKKAKEAVNNKEKGINYIKFVKVEEYYGADDGEFR